MYFGGKRGLMVDSEILPPPETSDDEEEDVAFSPPQAVEQRPQPTHMPQRFGGKGFRGKGAGIPFALIGNPNIKSDSESESSEEESDIEADSEDERVADLDGITSTLPRALPSKDKFSADDKFVNQYAHEPINPLVTARVDSDLANEAARLFQGKATVVPVKRVTEEEDSESDSEDEFVRDRKDTEGTPEIFFPRHGGSEGSKESSDGSTCSGNSPKRVQEMSPPKVRRVTHAEAKMNADKKLAVMKKRRDKEAEKERKKIAREQEKKAREEKKMAAKKMKELERQQNLEKIKLAKEKHKKGLLGVSNGVNSKPASSGKESLGRNSPAAALKRPLAQISSSDTGELNIVNKAAVKRKKVSGGDQGLNTEEIRNRAKSLLKDILPTVCKLPILKEWAEKSKRSNDSVITKAVNYVMDIGNFIVKSCDGNSELENEMWRVCSQFSKSPFRISLRETYMDLRSEMAR